MTITTKSPIVGKGGTVAEARASIEPNVFKNESLYIDELFRLCDLVGFDFRILFAQAVHETAAFSSSWWLNRRNPAGIGITGDPAQDAASHTWKTGTEAARAHVVHMWAYSTLVLPAVNPLVPYVPLDPRYEAVFDAGLDGSVRALGDLGNGKWATDPNYAPQIAAKANAIFANSGNQNGGSPTVTRYQVVGLPGPGIELPVPLSHDIIGLDQPNQRPGIARQRPGYWVQHETSNPAPGADAAMHDRWLHAGADGSQLSFHFCVDDGAIYQMIPIDEVTWQAADGAGPGNMSGISCELCVNADGDEAKARANAEALAGGICKALGLGVDRVKRHFDFNAADPDRHHCPDRMMASGYWQAAFVPNVAKIIAGNAAPAHKLPAGIDAHFLARHFAGHKDHTVTIDGTAYAYDADGPVSRAWLAHCLEKVKGKKAKTNARWWPPLVGVKDEGGARVYRFKDGFEYRYEGV